MVRICMLVYSANDDKSQHIMMTSLSLNIYINASFSCFAACFELAFEGGTVGDIYGQSCTARDGTTLCMQLIS